MIRTVRVTRASAFTAGPKTIAPRADRMRGRRLAAEPSQETSAARSRRDRRSQPEARADARRQTRHREPHACALRHQPPAARSTRARPRTTRSDPPRHVRARIRSTAPDCRASASLASSSRGRSATCTESCRPAPRQCCSGMSLFEGMIGRPQVHTTSATVQPRLGNHRAVARPGVRVPCDVPAPLPVRAQFLPRRASRCVL